MKRLSLLLGFVGLLAAADSAPDPGWTTAARVTRVIDGDTLEVEIRRTVRIRLKDCWAPESRRDRRVPAAEQDAEIHRGLASKEALTAAAAGRDVIVHIDAPEDGDLSTIFTLGRVVGKVWLVDQQDESLNERQVREGHATKERSR